LLRDEFELPGMRVLQFAFGKGMELSPHIPHNYSFNSVAYTGTHDNNTIKGWFRTEADVTEKNNLKIYCGQRLSEKKISELFLRMTMSSVAKICIIPIQDLLGLSGDARMNAPSSAKDNWLWRLTKPLYNGKRFKDHKRLTNLYNRL